MPMPMPAASTNDPPASVAVFPIQERDLFRAERAELRGVLAVELAKRAPQWKVLPLPEVDAKLAPLSKKAHARCAFEEGSLAARAEREDWLRTNVYDVNFTDGRAAELWVEVMGADTREAFTAPWGPAPDLMTRYKTAFASLVHDDAAAMLGILGGGGTFEKAGNGVSVCEGNGLECLADSKAWFDQSASMGKCFEGTDHDDVELLLDPSASPAKCEITNLDDVGGVRGKRETCLCAAMRASQGLTRNKDRRHVSIAFDAPDLVGKPRPTVRVVEATTNLGSDRSWTHGEGGIPAVYRLSVDGEEHLAGALARCAPPPGTVNVVDMTLDETGRVAAVRAVLPGASTPPAVTKDPKADNTPAACIDKALFAAAFACTDDGESAKVRLEIAWPGKP